MSRVASVLLVFALAWACTACDRPPAEAAPAVEWAIAIHGGAGSMSPDMSEDVVEEFRVGLRAALDAGREVLESGGTALDAVERAIVIMEDDPHFNAGRGAVFDHDGNHSLDAAIMDGSDLSCGAVAGVDTVRNPIKLATLVKDRTRHVLLIGAGAERFADETGVDRVERTWFDTTRRRETWQRYRDRWESSQDPEAEDRGTVGVVALDRAGNLAAGTSSGGLTGKRFGRIGDVPIIGAGTYADNATCAVSCTGVGEEFIRFGVAQRIASLMRYRGDDVGAAADRVVHRVLRPGDGGVIALDRDGKIAMTFNTSSMLRGAADSTGRYEVGIWAEE